MNNTKEKPKVPTLLELALPRKKKVPSSSQSDDSEHDILLRESSLKPPDSKHNKSTPQSKGLKKNQIVQPSPNTKRKKFKSKKYEKMMKGFVKDATSTPESISLTAPESEAKELNTTAAYKSLQNPPFNMTNMTGSSGIYSTSYRQFRSNLTRDNQSLDVGQKTRNYHIKVIRRGIPDIVSTDVRGRAISITTQDVEMNPYCVCQNSSHKIRSSLAWMFTVVAAFLCIICPLLSFSADVTFFIICSDHYAETKELLHYVQRGGAQTAIATFAVPKEQFIAKKHLVGEQQHPAPYRSAREASKLSDQQSSFNFQPVLKKQLVKRNIRHEEVKAVTSPVIINVTAINSEQYTVSSNFSLKTATSQPAPNAFNPLLYSDLTDCKIPVYKRKPVCNNASVILEYMSTTEASLQLEAHRHVTSDVFEPVFIIGSFPSLVLCIFTRLVVMISKHDHFLSAYVINMASMPLQLVTGALAVHSASYHVGQNGFECWKCALIGNCSSIGPLEWLEDGVSVSLIVATVAKLIDGAAGGCVLFVVLFRTIWTRKGHVSCWWYVSRAIISSLSFIFCITVSSTMVLTPSVGVFRLEMMNKTAYFYGKETVCYISMALLGMGLTAWGVSFLSLFIYFMYRTYVYCRIKEHLSDAVSI